jgi:dTDP-4-amino-4,6-dideoxygalactose transaminase
VIVGNSEAQITVPLMDICAQNAPLREELQTALDSVLDTGHFALGPAVESFEAAFAEFVGARDCVAVNSGTAAVHLALLAAGVGAGDEVITTPLTWISTSWAIRYVGARPVFVDVDRQTFNLDVSLVEAAITPRTKAILPVHLFGQAADLVALGELCERHGLALIEDAAQAHGAQVDGRRVGSFGLAGCFSFYPTKNLGAIGEAGAVVTSDQALAARLRRLRDHSQEGRHNHTELGFNARMDGLQGAALGVKLPYLDAWNAARARVAGIYLEAFKELPGLTLPHCGKPDAHVWHLFVVQIEEDREVFRGLLEERGIATAVHYPTPIHLQPAFADLGHVVGAFPVAEAASQHCLSLPIYPELKDLQIEAVISAVRAALGRG